LWPRVFEASTQGLVAAIMVLQNSKCERRSGDLQISLKGSKGTMPHFGDRLLQAMLAKKTPAMVGIDPKPQLLPKAIVERHALDRVAAPRVWAQAVEEFCSRVLDVVAPRVAVVKFQSAYFELLGAPGIATLRELLRKARRLGLLTILDAKRGDIGSTSEAYAESVFAPLAADAGTPEPIADAVTVSPYLGKDSLEPFVKYARESGCGVFVLVRTSNPGSRDLQQLATSPTGMPAYRVVATWVAEWSNATRGESGYGCVGAVVGGTAGDQIAELRGVLPHTWLLIPGYGAQGASAADIAQGMSESGTGALVNNSREILFPKIADSADAARDWESAVAAALDRMIRELGETTPAWRLLGLGERPV
jgi:orotidine-5'-phosphate decarboxylase